jgi:hypothetical protein
VREEWGRGGASGWACAKIQGGARVRSDRNWPGLEASGGRGLGEWRGAEARGSDVMRGRRANKGEEGLTGGSGRRQRLASRTAVRGHAVGGWRLMWAGCVGARPGDIVPFRI